MVISAKHKFTSTKPDGADATMVRATNWNDEHAITMAANRLMGRAQGTGPGAVDEISFSADLAMVGSVLGLSTATAALVADAVPSARRIDTGLGLSGGGALGADKTVVLNLNSQIPNFVPPFSGPNYVPMWNSLAGGTGRILFSDLIVGMGVVSWNTSILAGNGLSGGGDLMADRTITMRTPNSLTASTINVADSTGHTHTVNHTNIFQQGSAGTASLGVGTYLFARQQGGTAAKIIGESLNGSVLQPASGAAGGGPLLSGSWMCCGRVTGDITANTNTNITLWVRIA